MFRYRKYFPFNTDLYSALMHSASHFDNQWVLINIKYLIIQEQVNIQRWLLCPITQISACFATRDYLSRYFKLFPYPIGTNVTKIGQAAKG